MKKISWIFLSSTFLLTVMCDDRLPPFNFTNPNISYLNDVQLSNGSELDRNPFTDWLQSIFGSPPTTEAPISLDPPTHCDECKCGVANKKKRIVGGHETQVNQYPWMALLTYGNRFYCGATLINDRYVLTAAHCVSGFNKNRIGVTLLEHDRQSVTESTTIKRNVLRVVRHAQYSPNTYNNDIALIRMDRPVEFNNIIRPACLPEKGKSFSHLDGIVTGWGATKQQGDIATNLQEVTVPILSNSECRKSGYGERRITDNMLCAGFKDGEKDSCQGDSGGPLHIVNETAYHVVGVVSWGEGCAQPNYPGVYTRVNRYYTWLKSNTRDACYC